MQEQYQESFDFGDSNLISDIESIFEMDDFPDVSPEDVANKLRCRGTYALNVYDSAMDIWETVLDNETVEYLRGEPIEIQNETMHVLCKDFAPLATERIANILGQSVDSVQSEIDSALASLRDRLESVRLENAA